MAWTLVQASPEASAVATTVTPTFGAASTAGNTLTATLMLIAATATITLPSGWVQGPAVSVASGSRSEVWYYINAPATTSVVCTSTISAQFHAELEEWHTSVPGATVTANASGTATAGTVASLTAATAGSAVSGDLAVSTFVEHLTSNTGVTWTTPSGWTTIQADTSAATGNHQYAAYNLSVAVGVLSVTATSSVASTSTGGWTGAVITFTATPATPVLLGAAGFNTGSAGTTTTNVTFPVTLSAGDIMGICCADNASSGTVNWTCSAPVSGTAFTAIPQISGTSSQQQFLYKVADSQDVTNAAASTAYVVHQSVSHLASYVAFAYTNFSGLDPVPTVSGQANASSTTVSVAGITTGSVNDMLVWFGYNAVGSGGVPAVISPPSGFTAETTQSNTTSVSGTNVGILMADLVQAAAGATGAANGSLASAHVNGGMLLALTAGTSPVAQLGAVGSYITGTPTGGTWQASTSAAVTAFQTDCGRTLLAQRCYAGIASPTTVQTDWSDALAAKRKLYLSLKYPANTSIGISNLPPIVSATSQATLDNDMITLLGNLATAGFTSANLVIDLWQEPYVTGCTGGGTNSTIADFVTVFQHYATIIHANSSFPVGWCMSSGQELITQNLGTTAYPGDTYADVIEADYYTGAYVSGSRITGFDPNGGGHGNTAQYNPFYHADNASPQKPVAITETGGTLRNNGSLTTTTFVHYMRDAILHRASLGYPGCDVLWFNSGNDANNSPIVTTDGVSYTWGGNLDTGLGLSEYRNALFANLYDALQTPPTAPPSPTFLLIM